MRLRRGFPGRAKQGLNKLKFVPPTKQIALNQEKLLEFKNEKKVIKMVERGKSYEDISYELGISTSEAFELAKRSIDKWCGELALSAIQAREVQIRRLDALEAILWHDAEGRPIIDDRGMPVIDGATGKPAINPPDKLAIKLILDIEERRAKLLGLDAASKIDASVTVGVRREYVNADIDQL